MRRSMNSSRFSLRILRLLSAIERDATFLTAEFLSASSASVSFRVSLIWFPILTRILRWATGPSWLCGKLPRKIFLADATTWRNWYKAKGDAKRAQFTALEWWQVRGDN